MSISSQTRSKFSTDSIAHIDQAGVSPDSSENPILNMASSTDTDFEAKVNAEVAKVIARMMAAGTLVSPTSTSSTPSLYVTDPYKTDFNIAEKHGASLFSKATEELPDKDKFTLNTDKAKQLSHVLKTKASTYFWGTSVTKIP